MLTDELTPQEKELLVITMEECSELAMACSKVLRFGKAEQNLENLQTESADVTVMINLLADYNLISYIGKLEQMFEKKDKLQEYSSLFDD
jgi:NTP pyrophosphatase (non-canonical NTP hydrolase)